MNNISRNKIFIGIISVLLLTNIILLILFFQVCGKDSDHPKRLGFTEKLKTEVGFTEQQMETYMNRKKLFWEVMHDKMDSVKSTKLSFYHLMYDPAVPDSVIRAKAEQIGEEQEAMDLHVITHFKEVRKLCTPEQVDRYDSLLPPLIDRMVSHPHKRR